MPNVVAVVVAAGSGTRLGGEGPKALRDVAGAPLVVHALAALAAGGVSFAVVVVPALRRTDFERALAAAPLPHRTVVGGAERQQSVLAGLEAVAAGTRIVLVHDAARPFVPAPVVQRVIDAVRAGADAVIPVLPVVDTVRQVTGETSVVLERTSLRAVQTPQGFNLDVLLASHHAALAAGLAATDDARVCEFAGHPVTLVEGHREAFKVTEPIDLALAEALAASRTGVSR